MKNQSAESGDSINACPRVGKSYFLKLRNKLERRWIGHLTDAELKVALFISTRTWGWGKGEETIKRAHFIDGIGSSANRVEGLGYSVSKLKRTLRSLRERGVVTSEACDVHWRGNIYRLNPEWTHNMAKLNQPKPKTAKTAWPKTEKKSRTRVQNDTIDEQDVRVTDEPQVGSGVARISKEETFKEKHSGSTLRVEQHASSGELDTTKMSAAVEKSKTRRAGKKRKATLEGLRLVWDDSVRLNFAEIAPLTYTQGHVHALQKYQRRWLAVDDRRTHEQFVEYVEWVVETWSLLLSSAFYGMRALPEQPSLGFFTKFCDKFEREWNKTDVYAELAKLTPQERHAYYLRRKGMDKETADAVANVKQAPVQKQNPERRRSDEREAEQRNARHRERRERVEDAEKKSLDNYDWPDDI